LVLADPQLDFTTASLSSWRSGLQEMGLSLGQLPHARAEGREVIDRLQGRGTLWAGAEASEAALKRSDLSRYGILHFATHTVVDSANAERSAILLASGAPNQDGLLQSREIADLRLGGHVVVLSSCQSAMGTQVRGEGVLGLARSFFAAGARTVVGSLWPIRDDHAQAFFDPFYAALGKGSTVGAAFRAAQRRLIEKGLPMEAWAGFVLMGDPSITPVSPTDVGGRGYLSVVWVVGVAAMLLFIVWGARTWRLRRVKGRAEGLADVNPP
jgi:CHAT domain-containing protein